MPSADGRFKGFAHTRKSAEAWERIFGRHERENELYCRLADAEPVTIPQVRELFDWPGPNTVALPDQAQQLLEQGFKRGSA